MWSSDLWLNDELFTLSIPSTVGKELYTIKTLLGKMKNRTYHTLQNRKKDSWQEKEFLVSNIDQGGSSICLLSVFEEGNIFLPN